MGDIAGTEWCEFRRGSIRNRDMKCGMGGRGKELCGRGCTGQGDTFVCVGGGGGEEKGG
jgi:hypothetical protein